MTRDKLIILLLCCVFLFAAALAIPLVEHRPDPLSCFAEDYIAFIQTDDEGSVDEIHRLRCDTDDHCMGVHPMDHVPLGFEIDMMTRNEDGSLQNRRILFVDEEIF